MCFSCVACYPVFPVFPDFSSLPCPQPLSARPHCSEGHWPEHPLNLLVTVFFSLGPGRGVIGRGRGGFGGRGRGRGRGRGGLARPVLTKEQLDNQLDAYMSKTKGHLDAELDAYMAQTDPEAND